MKHTYYAGERQDFFVFPLMTRKQFSNNFVI
jgi:hypothetical protein